MWVLQLSGNCFINYKMSKCYAVHLNMILNTNCNWGRGKKKKGTNTRYLWGFKQAT